MLIKFALDFNINMTKFTTISCLIFYLIFNQVHSIMHMHVNDHEGQTEFQLSVHPPQIIDEDHHHSHDNFNSDNHEHNEIHVNNDGDYTFRNNKVVSRDFALVFINLINWDNDSTPNFSYLRKILPTNSLYLGHADIFLRGPPLQT